MTTQQKPFCGDTLLEFSKYYFLNIAGYADLSIRIIGSILNIFNMLVFTRKNMMSPANLIFIHLTFVDLLILLAGIPSSWYFYVLKKRSLVDEKWAYEWLLFGLYCADFMAMLHSISVWFTIMLTIWRYIAVVHPLKESNLCNMKMTRYGIIIGYVLCTVLCTPFFFSQDIGIESDNGTAYYVIEFTKNQAMVAIIFINNAVVFKLIPSVVLTVLSCRLVVTLLTSKKHHDNLTSSSKTRNSARKLKMKQKIDRSTRILLAVLVLFLIAEVPLGVLGVMNVLPNDRANYKCYGLLGTIFDTVTLINTSITFVVYYTMSRQFRTTFKHLFGSSNTPISPQSSALMRKISGNTISSQI